MLLRYKYVKLTFSECKPIGLVVKALDWSTWGTHVALVGALLMSKFLRQKLKLLKGYKINLSYLSSKAL